jgi:alpha-mannosidase
MNTLPYEQGEDSPLTPPHLAYDGSQEPDAHPYADENPYSGTEPDPEPTPAFEPDPDGWSFVALIPHNGKEPPADQEPAEALAAWCAVSAIWHPSLLARARELPRVESVDLPPAPGPREIRVVASATIADADRSESTPTHDGSAPVSLDSGTDREALIRRLQTHLGAVGTPETSPDEATISAALDFQALGTARWFLRDLTIGMGHSDTLNLEGLARETLLGARAWQAGDRPTAVNRVRAAFEILTQARERFYPVDAYFMDICLLDPTLPAGALADPLEARLPVTFLASAQAIEAQADLDPERVELLRKGIDDGWADVVGGTYAETEEPLLPVESILWQFRKGGDVYRRHLDGRNVETVARRRFGLYPQLPQIAKRFAFRFAIHLGFDAGRFPVRSEAKRLWESPDNTSLETLTRPPVAADRPAQGLLIPWKLAATMRDDHVATLPFLHWPRPVAPWFADLRRGSAYSPYLARWVTLNDYFHLTDRPYETFSPGPDSYTSPYLAQAVARRDPEPISRLARHHRLRARFEEVSALQALAAAVGKPGTAGFDRAETEAMIELGRHAEAARALDEAEPRLAAELARNIVGRGEAEAETGANPGRPGYLVLNPLGIPRRAVVTLPDAALDLRPEGPLRAAQFTDEGVCAVVDLPAFGFAWVPRDADLGVPPAPSGVLSAKDRVLKNESLEVEIDAATGGIRGVRAAGEDVSRLGQQLVANWPGAASDPSPSWGSKMVADHFEVEYAGPALVQAISRGSLTDPAGDRRIARFEQRFRLWAGRPALEIDVTLSDIDPAWLAASAKADPWTSFIACRWAWPDANSMLRRVVLGSPELTDVPRPETPDGIDISTRRQRTGLIFGGLPYHQRQGGRMLDTLLIAGAETGRSFRLGVVLDLEYPFHAAQDWTATASAVPTEGGPPSIGSTGWLAKVDHRAVMITHLEYVETTGEGRGWGFIVHLLETGGGASRCRLRLCRNPVWARQADFQGETTVDLPVEGDAVLVDLTPHELARVEVTME